MTDISLFVLVAYFIALVIALLKRGHDVNTPWLFLLRGFFPSWRFYDAPGPQPRLFVKALDQQGLWSQGQLFIPRALFRFRDLFHNPENNLRLTEQNLIDHLSLDLQSLPEDQGAETLVSYALTKRLAKRLAEESLLHSSLKAYQFELRMIPGIDKNQTEETILVSPIIEEASHVD